MVGAPAQGPSTTSVPVELRACAQDPLYFQCSYFYTLPGLDDDDSQPKVCEPWRSVVDLQQNLTTYKRVLVLKSRKVSISTSGLARALWWITFSSYCRVHAFSYRDDAGKDLLRRIKFAYNKLPPWMKLPIERENDHELVLRGTRFTGQPDDLRVFKIYPTTESASADETCDFAFVDEAARIANLNALYAAIEPTLRNELLIASSSGEAGPAGDFFDMCQRAKSDDLSLKFCFFPYTHHPRRDEAWRQARFKQYVDENVAKREWPAQEADAWLGQGTFVFTSETLDMMGNGAVGLSKPIPKHKYVVGWDCGRKGDAAVGIILDVSKVPAQLACYDRLVQKPFPYIQSIIEERYRDYRPIALLVGDDNTALAVVENLHVPAQHFLTGAKNKQEIIADLKQALEWGHIKAKDCPQLLRELRVYKWDDRDLVQDSVMALAIAWQGRFYSNVVKVPSYRIGGW